MSTTTLNIRVDGKTKRQAQKLFSSLGFDVSSAVKIFLKKAIETGSMPFRIGKMNDPRFMREIKEEVAWAKKYGKRYSSAAELFADWDKLNG
jgi:DNA-damage-inducible protein J